MSGYVLKYISYGAYALFCLNDGFNMGDTGLSNGNTKRLEALGEDPHLLTTLSLTHPMGLNFPPHHFHPRCELGVYVNDSESVTLSFLLLQNTQTVTYIIVCRYSFAYNTMMLLSHHTVDHYDLLYFGKGDTTFQQ